MKLDYPAKIQNDDPTGPRLDVDCTLDVSLEWEHGEPTAFVSDVLLDGKTIWRGEGTLFQLMAAMIAEQAEKDEWVLDKLMEAEGVSFVGGANNPEAHWVLS